MKSLVRSALVSRAAEIEGWFDEVELRLLVDCVAELALGNSDAAGGLNIVEVGSHKGRSTVAMGLTLAALSLAGKIYAIDPHEGVRSGKYDKIYEERPTYDDFLDNLKRFGIEEFVSCVRSKATDTSIDVPISLILIDAMHFFKNVSEDFRHFEKSIIREGMIAFHDYREEFPGVVEFVNSLIKGKNAPYRRIYQAHSLIVLKKMP
ncbi:MAG TPA: class I SAM-dependent methyltransferase [Pyrinomonadaceae bacterium]|nr:class I SAM-dependent methyltransferase [Pyrinomonadaceae bacterium]